MTNRNILIAAFLFISNSFFLSAQDSRIPDEKSDSTGYNIDKYVNQFFPENAEKTKNGYRYYFQDKDNPQKIQVKLSVVDPVRTNHKPNRHPARYLLFLKERLNSTLKGKYEQAVQ